MATINQLSSIDTLAAGDLLPVYDASNSDARKASISTLQSYLESNLDIPNDTEFTTQYAAPSATGFDVQITDGSASIWLILTPIASYAAGTITLPAVANCADKQEILVNCTQAVTALTVAGNGANDVIGEPTTLAANAYFRLKYDSNSTNWYRVG